MNTFQLRVDDRHVIESTDGESLYIKTTDGSRVGVEPYQAETDKAKGASLGVIEVILQHYGIGVPHRHRNDAWSLLAGRLQPIESQAKREPSRPFIAVFLNGKVKAQWNPPFGDDKGHWSVLWPDFKTSSPTEPQFIKRTFRSLFTGVHQLIEQSLISLHVSLDYGFLDEAVFRLTDALTYDGQINFSLEN